MDATGQRQSLHPRNLPDATHAVQDYAERRALRGELKLLAKEERSRQQKAVGECLARAGVVCATLTGCLSRDLEPRSFDLAVVDEAAQVRPLFLSFCAGRHPLMPGKCAQGCVHGGSMQDH